MPNESGPAPQLSPEFIESTRAMLTPAMERDFPDWYAKQKQVFEHALEVTSHRDPDPDSRSPQQAHFDASHALALQPVIRANIVQDLANPTAPELAKVKAQVEAVGKDYLDQLRLARIALTHEGIAGEPERLSALYLRQAAEHGRWLNTHLPNRPGGSIV